MIFDRTSQDVEKARELRAKLENGETITTDEYETLERGTMTLKTLNRIDGMVAELKTLMEQAGYYGAHVITKEWTKEDIFYDTDFEQFITNLKLLRKAYYVYPTTPETPEAEYHYSNINAIERILYDLRLMVDDMEDNYRVCGTFECGEN